MLMLNNCCRAFGWSMASRIALTRSSTWTKFRLTGTAFRVEHDRDGLRPHIFIRLLRANQIPPAWSAKNILTEGKLIFEIILLHDPRRTQATAIEIILNVILLEHHFFEHFGKRITARIRRMFLSFSHWDGVRVNEMPNARIAANQNKLLEMWDWCGMFQAARTSPLQPHP